MVDQRQRARHVTVTLPGGLHAELEQALARGAAGGNRSRLVADAVADWLRRERARELRAQLDRLDVDEQVRLAGAAPDPR